MGGTFSSDGEGRGAYRVLVGKHEEKGRCGRTKIDESMILKWISKKWDWEHWSIPCGS